jgi:hypothetical protein
LFGSLKTGEPRAESVEIKWPSGQQQISRDVEADKFYCIEEGRDLLELQGILRRASGSAKPSTGTTNSKQ